MQKIKQKKAVIRSKCELLNVKKAKVEECKYKVVNNCI